MSKSDNLALEAGVASSDSSLPSVDNYGSTTESNGDKSRTNTLLMRLPPRHMGWKGAVGVINASVIGVGVLTMPLNFAKLGWFLGVIFIIFCLAANAFVAYLMREIQRVEPYAISMADAAYFAGGRSESAKRAVRWVLYGEKLACTCPAFALVASTLGSSFYSWHVCHSTWCLISFVILVVLTQSKNVKETVWLNITNILTILASVVLVAVALHGGLASVVGTPEHTTWPPSHSFLEPFGALSAIVFAYAGNWLYFEVMAEMDNPADFMKSFAVDGTMQISLYAFVGLYGYWHLGNQAPSSIIDSVKFSGIMQAAALLLAIHIFAGTAVGTSVLRRYLHSRVDPESINADTLRAQLGRLILSVVIFGFCFLVVNVVPSFGILVTLLGAIFEAPISFIMPVVIYWGVMHHAPEQEKTTNWYIRVYGTMTVALAMIITVVGIIDAMTQISAGGHTPFSCLCAGVWNTCECSPSRMPDGACPAVGTTALFLHPFPA